MTKKAIRKNFSMGETEAERLKALAGQRTEGNEAMLVRFLINHAYQHGIVGDTSAALQKEKPKRNYRQRQRGEVAAIP